MTMQPVDSSAIRAIGHDPESNKLRVQFQTGGTYEYDGVPAEVHADLMAAPSIGRHHSQNIRGLYSSTKVL